MTDDAGATGSAQPDTITARIAKPPASLLSVVSFCFSLLFVAMSASAWSSAYGYPSETAEAAAMLAAGAVIFPPFVKLLRQRLGFLRPWYAPPLIVVPVMIIFASIGGGLEPSLDGIISQALARADHGDVDGARAWLAHVSPDEKANPKVIAAFRRVHEVQAQAERLRAIREEAQQAQAATEENRAAAERKEAVRKREESDLAKLKATEDETEARNRLQAAHDELAASTSATTEDKTNLGTHACVRITDYDWDRDGLNTVKVHGSAINGCWRDMRYVQITFRLKDASGAIVGNAYANVNGLQKGETWRFDGFGVGGDKASSVVIGDVTAF